MGKNLARAFSKCLNAEVKIFSDLNSSFLEKAKLDFPSSEVLSDWTKCLSNEIDAVIVATPAATHYEIVKESLLNGKHVFVEKPATLSYKESYELAMLAEEKKRVFMVGHTFLYHSGIQYIKNNLDELGGLNYFKSSRLNFGRIRSDVNSWWNLAPHDISIFLFLMNNQMPEFIRAEGFSFIQSGLPDYSHATLYWKNGVRGLIDLSWLSPVKDRSLSVIGRNKMFYFNDLMKDKVELHHKQIKPLQNRINPFQQISDRIEKPYLSEEEPLLVEATHFIQCILDDKKCCLTGSKHIINVTQVLEAGQRSIDNLGEKIALSEVALTEASTI